MPTFPAISGADIYFERPIVSSRSFRTALNDLETGARYAWPWRTNPLMSWELTYPLLTRAQVTTQEDFWNSVGGQLRTFSFTDPDNVVHAKCRFDQPALEVRFVSPGVHAIQLRIVEIK